MNTTFTNKSKIKEYLYWAIYVGVIAAAFGIYYFVSR